MLLVPFSALLNLNNEFEVGDFFFAYSTKKKNFLQRSVYSLCKMRNLFSQTWSLVTPKWRLAQMYSLVCPSIVFDVEQCTTLCL